jgi:sigma-54 specific flagellar transcriptional regulator A
MKMLIKSFSPTYPWPGNVRELEQAVRKIIINGEISGKKQHAETSGVWLDEMKQGQLTAQQLLSHYCYMLYGQHGTYEAVAEITALDRRTVKKYIDSASPPG